MAVQFTASPSSPLTFHHWSGDRCQNHNQVAEAGALSHTKSRSSNAVKAATASKQRDAQKSCAVMMDTSLISVD